MDNTYRGTLPDRWRKKLSDAGVLARLIKHFNNELDVPLDNGQVQLGVAFMRKLIPDLQATTVEVNINHSAMNVHELSARLSSLGYQPEQVWNQLNNNNIIEHVGAVDILSETCVQPCDQPVDKNLDDTDIIQTPPPPD